MLRLPKNPFEIHSSEAKKSGPANLDWDESAIDTQSDVEGFADEFRTQISTRWLQLVAVAECGVLVFQLFNLQIMQGSKMKALAE